MASSVGGSYLIYSSAEPIVHYEEAPDGGERVTGRHGGRSALVTGAASGIGAAIARRFAAEGAHVLVVDRNGEGVAQVARELERAGGQAAGMTADLADTNGVAAMAEAVGSILGSLDVLVNCAGIGQRPTPFHEMEPDEFDRILAANVRSVFLTTRALLPLMFASPRAVIVNVVSSIAARPRPGLVAYAASKAAVGSLTQGLALELAPRGIRVVGLCPSAANTPMLVEFMAGADTEESRAALLATIPFARLVEPDEIAAAACWVACDEAAMITGDLIAIDGGRGL